MAMGPKPDFVRSASEAGLWPKGRGLPSRGIDGNEKMTEHEGVDDGVKVGRKEEVKE